MNKIIVVSGPTASGKTALAVELAKLYGGEVISADSMQIYTDMDVASAKATPEEQQGIPHHLMNFLDPSQSFSVAEWVVMAGKCADDILARGKTPVICGGTGLYISSFVDNLQSTIRSATTPTAASFADSRRKTALRRCLKNSARSTRRRRRSCTRTTCPG